jgi:PAS domain S-box-containing protein
MEMPPRKIPHAAELSLAFAVVLVLLIGILAYRTWADFNRSSEQVEISQKIIDRTNTLLSSLKDVETGQRGFLLTGQDRYLDPYRQALTEVSQALIDLANVTAVRRPDQAERVNQLRPLVKDKLDELGETIQLRRSQGPSAALALVLTDRGKVVMDEIRALCAQIQSAANQRVTQFSAEARASSNRLGIVSSIGSTALLALLLLATATIRRGRRRREQLIRSLNQNGEKLRESRDLLHTTLNSIGDGVITTDAEGRITFGNPVTQSILRLTDADLLGKDLNETFKLVNEHTRATVQSPVEKVLREGAIVGMANHTLLICSDGREIPIDDSAAPIRAADGNVQGTVMVFRDISERRRAEQTSRLLASIVESSDDAIISKDLNGIVTSWNAAAERIFGYIASEMTGKPIATIAAPDRLDEMPAILERVRNGEQIKHYETVRKAKSGALIDISLTVSPVRDASGRIIGASKIARDITETKKAEERVRASQQETREAREWLSATLSSIGDAVIATDDVGNVKLMNPVASSLTGWTQAEAIGRPLEEVFSISNEDTGARVESPVSKALRAGCIVGIANHTQLTAKDGRVIPIDDSAAPIRDAGRVAGVVMIFRDITERRKAELELRRTGDALRKTADELRLTNGALLRANDDLNQFAFAASHDLQEPLRMITSYSQLLLKGYRGQLDGEAATCIEFITDGTKRMRELLADLLAYTQVASEHQEAGEPIDFNQVFHIVLANCKATIDETGASITSEPLPTVHGQEPHFIQLLQNLITNGLRYRDSRPPRIYVNAERENGMWRFAVRDNGIGIAPEYHKHIFGLFKRLHSRKISGTGIGLAICQRVVERYGGKIWVESQENEGATFYFTLPVTEEGGVNA